MTENHKLGCKVLQYLDAGCPDMQGCTCDQWHPAEWKKLEGIVKTLREENAELKVECQKAYDMFKEVHDKMKVELDASRFAVKSFAEKAAAKVEDAGLKEKCCKCGAENGWMAPVLIAGAIRKLAEELK